MDYKAYSETLMKLIMPQSFPLGVKILKKGDTIPDKVVRPGKFGIQIAMCQWTTLARRWGWNVCAMAEDINCTPCLAGFGFRKLQDKADLIRFFMEMGYFDSQEVASKLVEGLELLEPGQVSGILSFPLENSLLDPDLIVIYGNPAQMSRLAAGFIHHHGYPIRSYTGFGLSCLSLIMPFWRDEPTFIHPGRGERILGGTEDNEMVFSMPAKYLKDLVEGLENTHKKGSRYPTQRYLLYQPPLIPPMKALEERLSDPFRVSSDC